MAQSTAACHLSLLGTSSSVSLIYNPFSPIETSATFTVSVKNTANSACDGTLAIFQAGFDGLQSKGSAHLRYDIRVSGGHSVLNTDAPGNAIPKTARSLVLPSLAPGDVKSVSFELTVFPGQVAPPGVYSEALHLRLSPKQETASSHFQTPFPLFITADVPTVMSVNIAGAGQHTTLDFGTLSEGEVRSVSIQARANYGYRFSVTSEHQGAMVLAPASADDPISRVPYTVRLNKGEELTLTSERKVDISPVKTNLDGSSIPFEVKIGKLDGLRAGRYRDVIVLKIGALP